MGYTTTFSGAFGLNIPLDANMHKYLTLFSETRRMKRNVDAGFGVEGEFYVFGSGVYGQGHDSDIINYNEQPSTQPSLWCQWRPNEEGTAIEWDGGEKFYHYTEWLVYLIEKFLKPNGYILNGAVEWVGEDSSDKGILKVINNIVYVNNVVQLQLPSAQDTVLLLNSGNMFKYLE